MIGDHDAVALDELEAFPQAAMDALRDGGWFAWLVPEAAGGRLRSLDELLGIGRRLARRDLTVAIAFGQTFLGALPVWIGGSDQQARDLGARVMSGALGCLALTEEDHGSDLAASEVCARRRPGGWTLDGAKWCINNATRGETMTVLARTDPAGGPRGFSVFVVDKLRVGNLEPRPRLRTHGLRGADISGMSFRDAPLDDGALIGRVGHGLELVLRALQISRTLCAAFSLGAGDAGLGLALEFARGRRLYGGTVWDIPVARRSLAAARVDLAAAEHVAMAGARAASLLPGQMSVLSAVVKVVVPELVGDVLREAAAVLGARHYLREGPAALFQKMLRDHAVVGLFDGSTAVNLYVISGQLARLTEDGGDVRPLFGAEPAPPVAWRGLTTSNRGRDDLLGSAVGAVAEERDALRAAARDVVDQRAPAAFALARRYGWLVAAACCQHAGDPLAMRRMLARAGRDRPLPDEEARWAQAEAELAS